MPERIQLRRSKGWRKPEGAVVVARPTKWGNPYQAARCFDPSIWCVYNRRTADAAGQRRYTSRADAVAEAVRRYRHWLLTSAAAPDVAELRGRDLACWCALDAPCHADVLLEIANSPVGVTQTKEAS